MKTKWFAIFKNGDNHHSANVGSISIYVLKNTYNKAMLQDTGQWGEYKQVKNSMEVNTSMLKKINSVADMSVVLAAISLEYQFPLFTICFYHFVFFFIFTIVKMKIM